MPRRTAVFGPQDIVEIAAQTASFRANKITRLFNVDHWPQIPDRHWIKCMQPPKDT
ncbi:unnamed protein product [Penicillium roqueforti FM164]|uniref:Uncharacterized protein n=1 Tax=Penicillium roqueforti (strain FM164) TaxID=1365484 RepID=W6QJH5_PENRF|nr:unnamed protein product [Penicillium roqueforti FM164]